MSKFIKDICRATSCSDEKFCTRCNTLGEEFFRGVVADAIFEEDACADLDVALDDLDQVELLMAVEEAYDIEIPDLDAEPLKTPRHLQNYLQYILVQRELDNV